LHIFPNPGFQFGSLSGASDASPAPETLKTEREGLPAIGKG
jgi:hypothetical protein